ncbi:beta-ketoacyl synthase N-terminal-like domain-containing protein [Streptacidiphilus cavernicola]|uniref:Beta-ketoacyl synthase N-terminal-like domain-containing protein n=1 Tax=Streptacidiphilus cavernicola TaxID=3342716 RepID=A0ABV6VY40_9ACTN
MLTVTGWSAVSPYGLGRDAFTEGVLARRPTGAAPDRARYPTPDEQACLVPNFDVRQVLGRKGTRAMNRVTGLAVSAVGALARPDGEGPGTALVLGTTTGSLQSMTDFTRASLTGDRPFDVDPTVIPNSVMNCAAAQCAIWHRIEGPNTTLACGRPSGLLALAYARRLLRNGRADAALCGAAEEYTSARSWIEHHSRDGAPALLGEGAAVLRVELGGGGPDGERGGGRGARSSAVLALHSRVRLPGADTAAVVAAVVRQALLQAELTADQVWAAIPSGLCAEETTALEAAFGADPLHRVPPVAELLGDTGAASAAFQLATALALAAEAPGRIAVVTSVDPDGMVAAAVLRLAQEPQAHHEPQVPREPQNSQQSQEEQA